MTKIVKSSISSYNDHDQQQLKEVIINSAMATKVIKDKVMPLIYVHNQLTPERSQLIIDRVRKYSRAQFAAVGLIVNLPSQRAVQIDKLAQMLKKASEKNNFPIIGFTQSECSPQSYYLLSICDKIYASPTTLFTFKRSLTHLSFQPLLTRLGLKTIKKKTNSNLHGRYWDPFTPPDVIQYANSKPYGIDSRLLKYSISNRQKINQKVPNPPEIQDQLLGIQAKQIGLVDEFATYEEIIKRDFQDAKIVKIQYGQQIRSMLNFFFFITSPILMMIFLFKVFLKYSILMYIWIKAKATGKTRLADVVSQENIELDEEQAEWIRQYDERHKIEQK